MSALPISSAGTLGAPASSSTDNLPRVAPLPEKFQGKFPTQKKLGKHLCIFLASQCEQMRFSCPLKQPSNFTHTLEKCFSVQFELGETIGHSNIPHPAPCHPENGLFVSPSRPTPSHSFHHHHCLPSPILFRYQKGNPQLVFNLELHSQVTMNTITPSPQDYKPRAQDLHERELKQNAFNLFSPPTRVRLFCCG